MKFKRRRLLLGLLVLVLLGLGVYLFSHKSTKKVAKGIFSKETKTDIVNAGPMDNQVVLWDGDRLTIYDKHGKVKARVDRSRENLSLFIGKTYLYLYRPGDQSLDILDKNGKTLQNIQVQEPIFQVQEEEGQPLIHCKGKGYEVLYLVQAKEVIQLFKTDNAILHFYVKGPEDFAVSELSTSASGYKTRVYIKDQEMVSQDIQGQVSLGLMKDGDTVYMATDKKLLAIKDGASQEVDIPLISGLAYKDGTLYLLHSGVISSYNKKLEEVDKAILSMNAQYFFNNQGSLYATAGGEVAGNLATDQAFYQPLSKEMDYTKVQGNLVVSYQDRKLWVHELVND